MSTYHKWLVLALGQLASMCFGIVAIFLLRWITAGFIFLLAVPVPFAVWRRMIRCKQCGFLVSVVSTAPFMFPPWRVKRWAPPTRCPGCGSDLKTQY
jgi:hypothetical protein